LIEVMPRTRHVLPVALLTSVLVVSGCAAQEAPGSTPGSTTTSFAGAPTSGTRPAPTPSGTALAGGSVTGRSGTFTVTAPEGWTEASGQVGAMTGLEAVLLSDQRTASFSNNLVVTSMPGDAQTAKDELAKGRQTLEGQGGTVTETPDKQVAGESASGLATAFEQQGIKVLARSYTLTHDGRVYLLTLSSSQEDADQAMAQFDEILSSWRWA
jgi:hypothetical protein